MKDNATKAIDQIRDDVMQEAILQLNIFAAWLNEQVTTKANIERYHTWSISAPIEGAIDSQNHRQSHAKMPWRNMRDFEPVSVELTVVLGIL